MDEKECSNCKEKSQACVPFFIHENDMMHKDIDNERMHDTLKYISDNTRKTIRTICITFIAIIIIFVAAYTVRTSIWLNTINRMNDVIVGMANTQATTETEVAHGIHQQPD